jgi:hypothetical protein
MIRGTFSNLALVFFLSPRKTVFSPTQRVARKGSLRRREPIGEVESLVSLTESAKSGASNAPTARVGVFIWDATVWDATARCCIAEGWSLGFGEDIYSPTCDSGYTEEVEVETRDLGHRGAE